MPEEEAKRKRPDNGGGTSMNLEGPIDDPTDEDKGRATVGNVEADNVAKMAGEGRPFREEMAGNATSPLDEGNPRKTSSGAIGKFSRSLCGGRGGEGRERTIPVKENLAVRYVKMRENKMADARDCDEENGGSKGGKIPEMSEKFLEGILGVKAERKKGERWVKLTEKDVEYEGEEQRKGMERHFEGKTKCKEEEKWVEMEESEVRGGEEAGKAGERIDEKEDAKGGIGNHFEGKTECTEGEKWFKMEVSDAKGGEDVGNAGRTKTEEEEGRGEKPADFDPEREESEGEKSGGKEKMEERGGEKSRRRRFSSENVGARLVRTRNLVRMDCITLARGIRARKKEKSAALKCSLERRVESVERILEDRMGNFLEETAEKHPWLQPLETWIVDRYKSARPARPSRSVTRAASFEADVEKAGKEENEEEATNEEEADGGEIFIESTKKTNEDRKGSGSSFESAESSPDLGKTRGKNRQGKEETPGKIERSHHVDLLDKLRDGFKEKYEDVQRYFQRTSRLADVNRKLKSQIWSSVVTIVLVEAKNLLPMDIDGLSDPYVKFRLGTEKYKSKVVNKTLSPVWLEQFDLHLYEDPYLGQELEVTVWDRDKSHQDDLMGRTTIDLASMERETTHRLWRDLEDGAGNIYLLLTISGTTASETISDLAAHEETPQERSRLLQKYSLRNTLQRPRDVGHLTVKVYRAQGLAAADLGGKSDPFCVLELVNARLQTQTEYKTLAPNWQKIFTFNVKDINSVLEVTVYDEDRDHKVEFLGRVAIPLLRIRNAEKRWYALKDKKLRGRAKGNSPQIMLEMIVVWNVFRACARTLNPKEKKYMEPEVKFKRQVFLRNVLRLKAVIVFFIDMGKYIQSCWEWESKTRSIVALVMFVLLCYYFEPWMIPTAALLILMKYCMVAMLTGGSFTTSYQHSPSVGQLHDSGDAASDEGPPTPGDDDDDEDDKDKEEKKSLKERLQAIQEVTQTVQNSIGYIASLCERIKNLFNFTVPYLSYLAMFLTILCVIVLYFVPMRYLILAWGVNKFLRKLLRPHSVPNNEVLDLISRVPDDEDLHSYRELKPVPTADCERGGTGSTSGAASTSGTRRDHRKKHKAA